MESLFGRYRNLIILLGALFLQAMGLALQVRRTVDNEPTRLIRVWTVAAVTPFEKAINWVQLLAFELLFPANLTSWLGR